MIHLHRVRTRGSVPASFRGDKRVAQALTLLAGPGAKRKFDEQYWRKAKKQLKAESGGKCAYCEAPTSVVAHGDVEHFRPKSIYWWLAYCYDNYLFACQICNQIHKGDHFPLADEARRLTPPVLVNETTGEQRRELARRFAPDPLEETGGQPWSEFEAAHRSEGALLPNPYTDDVEAVFAWEADPVLREVAARPANAAARPLYEAAERFFGLNRPELLAERWKTYEKLETFVATLDAPGLDEALRERVRDMLVRMMETDAPFAGMCRYFVRRVWGLPL